MLSQWTVSPPHISQRTTSAPVLALLNYVKALWAWPQNSTAQGCQASFDHPTYLFSHMVIFQPFCAHYPPKTSVGACIFYVLWMPIARNLQDTLDLSRTHTPPHFQNPSNSSRTSYPPSFIYHGPSVWWGSKQVQQELNQGEGSWSHC